MPVTSSIGDVQHAQNKNEKTNDTKHSSKYNHHMQQNVAVIRVESPKQIIHQAMLHVGHQASRICLYFPPRIDGWGPTKPSNRIWQGRTRLTVDDSCACGRVRPSC